MSENSLPEKYKGFSTAELLALWLSIPDRTLYDPPTPDDKILAMRGLIREYALMDWGKNGRDAEKIRRVKRLLAPYGIDIIPWADENGIEQEHLRQANSERLIREAAERRKRNKALYKEKGPYWKHMPDE